METEVITGYYNANGNDGLVSRYGINRPCQSG